MHHGGTEALRIDVAGQTFHAGVAALQSQKMHHGAKHRHGELMLLVRRMSDLSRRALAPRHGEWIWLQVRRLSSSQLKLWLWVLLRS